ncbi:hypothetical protein ES705_31834 [subsurface metagenome]
MKAAIQLISIAMVAAGITFEVLTGAHLGYVLITGGALAFAISTKIKK